MDVEFTIPQLNLIIASAKKLGFWDDVEHFTKLRDGMQAQS
jgi:hypothetical protein